MIDLAVTFHPLTNQVWDDDMNLARWMLHGNSPQKIGMIWGYPSHWWKPSSPTKKSEFRAIPHFWTPHICRRRATCNSQRTFRGPVARPLLVASGWWCWGSKEYTTVTARPAECCSPVLVHRTCNTRNLAVANKKRAGKSWPRVYIYIYIHVCMHACMHACMDVYVCRYVCVYIYILCIACRGWKARSFNFSMSKIWKKDTIIVYNPSSTKMELGQTCYQSHQTRLENPL